jgi:RNase adapter protein RapZ
MRFVIITGLSGAGKSQAINALEDLGYFCVDNLPPQLIPKFADLCFRSHGKIEKIALVIDIRGGVFFNDLVEVLEELESGEYSHEILFLEASDEVIIKRFKETRRKHPLAPSGLVSTGIKEERKKLEQIKAMADQIIDTSNLKPKELKREIAKIYQEDKKENRMLINILSFGFKYGVPLDGDLVFDVRFLPNPFYIENLRPYTGKDENVQNYVLNFPETKVFLNKLEDMLDFLIPNYEKEGKSQLVIGIGCTGGKHRSVTIANDLYHSLTKKGHWVVLEHRDIEKDREALRE